MLRNSADSTVATEIFSRLPLNQGIWGAVLNLDPTGNVHESCHRLNAWALKKHGRPNGLDNASYMPGGWAFVAPEPRRFTFRDVVARTRQPFPSVSEDLFRDWNRQPFYVFNEYSCYANGAIFGIEAGQAQTSRTRGSFRCATDVLAHVRTVGILARETGYPHVAELAGFIWHVEQLHKQIASHIGESDV